MSRRFQVDPFDLLGQKEPFPIAVKLRGTGEPRLAVAWKSFHQSFFSELLAFFQWTRLPKSNVDFNLFRDCRVTRSIPARAIFAAALWHVVFFIVPWPALPGAKRNPAFDNTELTWSGPIDDLPLLNVPKQATTVAGARAREREQPGEGTEAFHPRQRIFTDPVHPTHPRQTLLRPSAPMEAPKFLPSMPNIVQLAAPAAPSRPRLEISEETLAKLRPKEVKRAETTNTRTADAPNLETHPADMSMASITTAIERPKLEVNTGSAPRMVAQTQKGEIVPTPELAAGTTGSLAGPSETIIALSSAPGPPAPVVEVPKGNLAANVAISPEGKGAGTGGGSGSTVNGAGSPSAASSNRAGSSAVGISISGGSPKPNAGLSGLGSAGKLSLPKVPAGYKRPDTNANLEDPPERTGPPDFAALPPGTPAEQIFATHRVYSMNVNMPNLNSATGSWIIHFAELRLAGTAHLAGDLSAPVPLRKIDPKYPQSAIQEHIQGEVILYGVIRQDGSVDSIQLVHGIDGQLDTNAIAAFAQWKFQPATKGDQPVALEAIVHIPFREPER